MAAEAWKVSVRSLERAARVCAYVDRLREADLPEPDSLLERIDGGTLTLYQAEQIVSRREDAAVIALLRAQRAEEESP
jgi:hypothetical protein